MNQIISLRYRDRITRIVSEPDKGLYADPCFAIYRGAERFGVFVILAAFRPQSIGRVVVEDDALQRPGIIRIVGIFRGNFKLQGAAGGNLHPLEANHLKPIRIFCDLIAEMCIRDSRYTGLSRPKYFSRLLPPHHPYLGTPVHC